MLDKSLAREQLRNMHDAGLIERAERDVGEAHLDFADKRTGESWPSLEALAIKARCSVRTVSRANARFKELCWLSWRQRRDTWCRNLTNVYRVLAAAVRAPVDKSLIRKKENTKRGFSATVSNGSGGKLLGGVFAALENRIMAGLAAQGRQLE